VRDILVLSYHAVSDDWPSPLAVRPADLERQVRRLMDRGYRPTTVSEAVHGTGGRRVVAITFDDAYRSVATNARPLLDRLGAPATVFAVTDYTDSGALQSWPGLAGWADGPYARELEPMSWDEVAALADSGWEIGSHTRSHPKLTTLGPAQLAEELAGSRLRCEEVLGRPCRSLAYPFGDHDSRVVEAAGTAGYTIACTVPDALRPAYPLRWPRIGIYRDDTPVTFAAKVSPLVRRGRSTVAGPPAARALRRARGR
jgi:peptidoglycan/xylan/chitin deacetylase (PgdA/CDA1 family)